MKWSKSVVLIIIVLQQFLVALDLHATRYYFSSSAGDDSRNNEAARDSATPWKTLDKLNSIFSALHEGDSLLLKRNDIFYGEIIATASGTAAAPIVVTAYGAGTDPVISGLSSLSDWSLTGRNIWEAQVPGHASSVQVVFINGMPQRVGRYPNASSANAGYLHIQGVPSANTILVSEAVSSIDWMGADVVIRKNHWVIDRNRITRINGNNLQYISESPYSAATGYGYFIENHPATLDTSGEWYYQNVSYKLGIYSTTGKPAVGSVEASTKEQLVRINNHSNISFEEISFKGANNSTFEINQASNIVIRHCGIHYSGNTGIHAFQSGGLHIIDCLIDNSANVACDVNACQDLIVSDCTITNSGTIAGSGKGDSGSYEALLLSGNNQLIQNNKIENTGYIPVTFNGNRVTVRNNFINYFGYVKDDGGGIYTWNNGANAPVHNNRLIDGNIVLNGIGAADGTADRKQLIHGIYIDDNSDHVLIKNNTVSACGMYGIYVHNAHELILDSNTCYDNVTQVAMIHDGIAPAAPLRNILSTNNIFFSKTSSQAVAIYESTENDLTEIGSFDYNFYCRPLDEQSPIHVSWKTGGGIYDLEAWQQLFNADRHSKRTAVAIAPFKINNFTSPNLYQNGSFGNNINNLYVYSASGNATAEWWDSKELDAGSLKIAFKNFPSFTEHASLIIGIGSVHMGRAYIVRYDEANSLNKYFENYFRLSLSPYSDLSQRKFTRLYNSRTVTELFLIATGSATDASLGLDIQAQAAPLYIDNLEIREANLNITNPDDSIRFLYNQFSKPVSFVLDDNYSDVAGKVYNGSITIPAFRSAILIKKMLVTLPVVFSAFYALQEENSVVLKWITDGLVQNEFQQVQKSSNGKTFFNLGSMKSSPDTTNRFLFVDKNPGQVNYYRIRYSDGNGKSLFSKTILIRYSNNINQMKLRLTPNPVHEKLTISINPSFFLAGMLVIKSINGNIVRQFKMDKPMITLNVTDLSKGSYLVSAIINKISETVQFQKL